MVATFVLPLVMLAPIQVDAYSQVPLHQQMNIKLTGKNGYEDYLEAGDFIVKGDRVKLTMEFLEGPKAESYLRTARRVANEFQPMIALIQKGNQRETWDPREFNSIEMRFPELFRFRLIGRILVATAYARLADGQDALAADAIIALAEFANKSIGRTLISMLSGLSSMNLAYQQFADRWGSFSVAQLGRIEKVVEGLAKKPSNLKLAMESEFELHAILEKEMEKNPNELFNWIGDSHTNPALKEYVGQASPEDRRDFLARVFKVRRERLQKVIALLDQPESKWIDPNEPIDESTLEGAMLAAIDFVTNPVLIRAAQITTSHRLLRLHLQIAIFRWEHTRIPESLAMLPSQDGTFDPLANAPFQYEPRADGTYRLYSKGNKITGEFELGVRATRPVENPEPLPPYSFLVKKLPIFKRLYGTNAH